MMQQEQRAVGRLVGLWLIVLTVLGVSVWGQTQSLTVTSYSDAVRFSTQGAVKELRVEILSLAGQKVFDSGPVSSGVLDWKLLNSEGQLVANGVYLYSVTVKDEFGNVTKKLGKLALVRGKPGAAAPPLSGITVGELATGQPRLQIQWDVTGNYTIQGNLGVGTETPSTPIHVRNAAANALITLDGHDTGFGSGELRFLNDGVTVGRVLGTSQFNYLGFIGSGSTWFRVFTGGAERLRVTNTGVTSFVTGNLGIGTTSPGERLTVAGNASLTGTVDAQGQMSKMRFHYDSAAQLPDPTAYHGMFAHVHDQAAAYFAHAGAWLELQQRVSGSCSAGNAIRVVNADGTVTCESLGGAAGWALTGNSISAGQFLGTTNNEALDIRVNNARALRLEPHATSPNIIGGFSGNSVTGGVYGATISGGGASGFPNTASGSYATVGGGDTNTAAGDYSFVVGRRAKNTDVNHNGVFIFADSTAADFSSSAANQFNVRASGGYRLYSNSGLSAGVTMAAGASAWSSVSDRALKENFTDLDGREVLHRLSLIPISEWNYKAQDASIRHIGPMAQDFYAAFGLGESDQHISTIDADGIALLSIQALYQMGLALEQKDKELEAKVKEIDELRARLEALEKMVQELKEGR